MFTFSRLLGKNRREENNLLFEGEIALHLSSPIERFIREMANTITLHIFNYYGYYAGSFYPRTHYNSGYMTLRQCEYYLDENKRFTLARKFVEGSLSNIIRNLTYYENRGVGLSAHIKRLKDHLILLNKTQSIEELMSVEGRSKEEYYCSLNEILKNDYFRYTKRERRPPKGPLDTLLSFGNSLLYVTILGEIYKTHLDPRIGFLHTSNFRKFSLNLDIAEVFKPVIIDRIIFTLVNKKMVDESSFEKELGGIYLNEKGRRIFVEEFDRKMNQVISLHGRRCSYQRLIRLELYKIEKHLMGEKEYHPFISQW
ncbi:type I-B CRISPR-associated endonuclease Cas1 [Candidatus Bathyarchaeota archaeon]|nr:type I-B CRISPR-associated endonuclease Cas1 [Candidatus Bathyarchaeota archaeon]